MRRLMSSMGVGRSEPSILMERRDLRDLPDRTSTIEAESICRHLQLKMGLESLESKNSDEATGLATNVSDLVSNITQRSSYVDI
jgi:hypothetical protein